MGIKPKICCDVLPSRITQTLSEALITVLQENSGLRKAETGNKKMTRNCERKAQFLLAPTDSAF